MMATAFVLLLMVVAITLFSLERVPVDVVALGLLVALLVSGILTPAEALRGFASDAVIVIGALFVLTAGLRASGVLDALGRWAQRLAGHSPRRAAAALLTLVGTVSAFINNTTTTAAFLPLGVGLAKGSHVPPSRLLMPLAFASILGGSITLVGTSTNVIVSSLLPAYGEPPLGLFELAPVALPIALAGLAYLVWLAPRLLPERPDASLEQTYSIREYLSEVEVEAGSPVVGRTVAEEGFGRRWGLNLLAIVRRGEPAVPGPEDRLAAGDLLLVEGRLETLLDLGAARGLTLRRRGTEAPARQLATGEQKLVEVVVLPRSELVGRTLAEVRFRQRYGAGVIAFSRHAEPLVEKIGRIAIRVGDLLLIQGARGAVERLLAQRGLLVLSDRPARVGVGRAAWIAPLAFGLAIVLAATGVLALPAAVLLGCLLLFASRTLSPQEAYAAVEWPMLMLIAGMIGYGAAMEKTGAAALIAEALLGNTGHLGPVGVLGAFYLLTVVLTQPMSNQAAALVVLPIAMQVAAETGIDPRAMAVTVALAASSSFLTPLEPSCLLVYGPGRYRFLDFPRLGLGLTLIALALTLALVPRFWPPAG